MKLSALNDPKHKISRQFSALQQYKDHGFAYPLTAEIDLTWRCALNCKGCHSKWLHQDMELKPNEISRILSQLKEHGCKSIVWSGGGEPLESLYWHGAIMEADLEGFSQGLYSYFPEPSQHKIDFLEYYMDFVYSHNFKTEGLKRGSKRYPTRNVWTAGYLLDKDNWSKIPRFIDQVDLDFFDYVDFRPLILEGETDYRWVANALELFNALEDMYSAEMLKKAKYAEYKFRDLLRPDFGRTYGTCVSTDFVAVVGPDGTLWECVNRRGKTPLGNLLKESLSEIWSRKDHCRTEFEGCRILCRNNEMNKELDYLLGPSPRHELFV